MNKGRFITIEGGEGVGKSTLINSLKTWLEEQGISVLLTREPGGTPFAEDLRKIILHEKVDPKVELLLFFASRLQHIQSKIEPALKAGTWVICDRFSDSTAVYQGVLRGLGVSYVESVWNTIVGSHSIQPDVTLLLDCPVDIAFKRIVKRKDNNKFEAEEKEFHEKLRKAYLDRASQYTNRIHVLDASKPPAHVFTSAKEYLK